MTAFTPHAARIPPRPSEPFVDKGFSLLSALSSSAILAFVEYRLHRILHHAALSRDRLDRTIDIPVFPDVVTGNRWANTFLTPAEFGLVDSSETRFILEHQAHFSTVSTATGDFFFQFAYYFFNFFEVAMTSSLAVFGCLLRGITFLQPCRRSTR